MIVVELCIMIDDCEWNVGYGVIVHLGKGLFQINIHDVLILGTCD